MLGVFEISRTVLSGSFADIETDTVRQSLQRVANALDAELRQIGVSASDYAHWDDTYNYVLTRNPAYVKANIFASSMATINIDVYWIIDERGQDVVAAFNDPAHGVQPIAPDLLAELRRYIPLIKSETSPAPRLLRTPTGVLAFSAASILHNDQSGPSVGSLVFGRFLTREDFMRVEETSQLPLRALPIDQAGKVASPLPDDVQQWLANDARPDGTSSYLRLIDDAKSLDGYQLLYDVEHRPVLLLSTSVKREALQLGEHTITWVIVVLVAGFAVVVLAMLTILNRSWRAQQATEFRYLTVASQLDECILLAEEATGMIFDVNGTTGRMLGYSKAELLELRLDEVFVALPATDQLLGDRASAARHELTL